MKQMLVQFCRTCVGPWNSYWALIKFSGAGKGPPAKKTLFFVFSLTPPIESISLRNSNLSFDFTPPALSTNGRLKPCGCWSPHSSMLKNSQIHGLSRKHFIPCQYRYCRNQPNSIRYIEEIIALNENNIYVNSDSTQSCAAPVQISKKYA